MQKTNSKNSIIIIVVVVLVLGLGYFFYSSGTPSDTETLIEADTASPAGDVGGRVLVLLNQINSLKIDASFFTTEAYSSLVDHTVPIFEQNVGKSNPFSR